jgi:hypothetical protein
MDGPGPRGFLCESVLREIYRWSTIINDSAPFDEEPEKIRFLRRLFCESTL